MALCRCLEMHGKPEGRATSYTAYLHPVGYPDTALTCGLCDNPGVIWVNDQEVEAYKNGERIFSGPNAFAKMRADDSGARK
jgi:hypothetical protein